jgi:hypothetical protein
MANTLPLNPDSWDLQLDAAGNLNLTTADVSIAQDVASAIRTFLGECWYDVSLGMPYFGTILGKLPPSSLIISKIEQAALTIATVLTVKVVGLGLSQATRTLTGTVVVTSTSSTVPLVATF